MIEVALDGISGDGMRLLHDFRLGDLGLVDIAATPMSRLLDAARRDHWESCGDPPRPEHPPEHLLNHHEGGLATEPTESYRNDVGLSHEEQERRYQAQYAQDAAEFIAWEAEARRDFEERQRESDGSGDSYS